MNSAELLQEKEQKIAALSDEVVVLKQQLDWFKRQLFGRKSEQQLIDNPHQKPLFEGQAKPSTQTPATDVKAHKRRRQKQRRDEDINDTGLRFDDTVPQQIIEQSVPELEGEDADDYEIIDVKETTRLAQRIGSYVVLVYRRPVVRHKSSQTITTPAAPGNVLDGCYADVSLLAGMMVDKAVYHLPLYRQHQRLLDSGIHLSRATLINWMSKSIDLLTPKLDEQKH